MRSIGKTLILLVVVLLIAQSVFVVFKTYEAVDSYVRSARLTTGKASGIVSLCINSPPIINLSDCSPNATQDVPYSCWVNASDADYVNFTYFSLFAEIKRAFNNLTGSLFNVTQDGFVNFTPSNDDVGNFTVQFTVNDGMGCSNSEDSEYLFLRVLNVNDPPVLLEEIPDQSIREGDVLYAFYLDNYFSDPDLDDLRYVVSGNKEFSVSINNFTSLVVISSDECDITEYVVFTAIDPYNETNTSNMVALSCVEVVTPQQGGSGGGSGGGGGGGISGPCTPEFECYDYHRCNRSNVKVQRCVDIHGCEPDVYLTVPCKYEEEVVCNESWNCSEWGPCLPNGTQYRECVDLNSCGTFEFMPELVQECEYIGTCDDGIKNCHDGLCEEGVDCGGPCAPCRSIEVPYPFEEERGVLVYVVTGIILFLLTAVLLYHYFRKEINAALARAGWVLSGRKKKQVLLSREDKRRLLAGIVELEKRLGRVALYEGLNEYSELLRYYLVKAVGGGLALEFDLDDLRVALHRSKRRVREVLRKVFVSVFEKFLDVEQNKALITWFNVLLLVEELRNLVLQTSEVEPDDVARKEKELGIPEKAGVVDRMRVRIINAYIALEFLEVEVAKKKYLELLPEYESLGLKEQEAVFSDLSRLYHMISYVNSWVSRPRRV